MNGSNLERLMDCAKRSPHRDYKHAAGIVLKSGRLVCASFNRWNRHAEHNAILKFSSSPYQQKDIDYLMVIRINRGGKLKYSKPCKKCQRLLERTGLNVMHS